LTALRNKNSNRDKIVMYLVEQCGVDVTRMFIAKDFQGGGLQRQRIYEAYADKRSQRNQDSLIREEAKIFDIQDVAEYAGCIPLLDYLRNYLEGAVSQLKQYNKMSGKIDWSIKRELLLDMFQGSISLPLVRYLKEKCQIAMGVSDDGIRRSIPLTSENVKKLTQHADNIKLFLSQTNQPADEIAEITAELTAFTGEVDGEWRSIKGQANSVTLICVVRNLKNASFFQSYFLGAQLTEWCEIVTVKDKHVLKLSCDALLIKAYREGVFSRPSRFTRAYTLVSNFELACSKIARLSYRTDPKTSRLELIHDSNPKISGQLKLLFNYFYSLCDCASVIEWHEFGFSFPKLSIINATNMKIFDAKGCINRLSIAVEIIKRCPGNTLENIRVIVDHQLQAQFLLIVTRGNVSSITDYYAQNFGLLETSANFPLSMCLSVNFDVEVLDCIVELFHGDGMIVLTAVEYKKFVLALAFSQFLRIAGARDIFHRIKVTSVAVGRSSKMSDHFAVDAILNKTHNLPDLRTTDEWGLSLAFYLVLGDMLRGGVDAELISWRVKELSSHNIDLQSLCSMPIQNHELFSGLTLPFLVAKCEEWSVIDYLLRANLVSVDVVLGYPDTPGMSFVEIAASFEAWNIVEHLIKDFHADTRKLLCTSVVTKHLEMVRFLHERCNVELAFDNLASQFRVSDIPIVNVVKLYPASRQLKDKTPRFTLKELADHSRFQPMIDYIHGSSKEALAILKNICQIAKIESYEIDTGSLPHLFSLRIPRKTFDYLKDECQIGLEVISKKKGNLSVRLPLTKKMESY
jgi:hypothetical protein